MPSLSRNDAIACLASGVLLAAAFPSLSLTWVIVFALVPLFVVLKPGEHKENAKKGFWTGLFFYCFSLYWFLHVTFGGTIVLILVLSGIFALLAVAAGWEKYPALKIPLIGLVWAVVEYLRSLGIFSFAWDFLGHALYTMPTQLQITHWLGVYALTFLIVATNMALAELWPLLKESWRVHVVPSLRLQPRTYPYFYLIALAILWSANDLYGRQVLRDLEERQENGKPFRVAMIQGNYQQGEKENATVKEMLATYLTLSEQVLPFRPDLILWPESTIPSPINYWPSLLRDIQAFVDQHQVQILSGTVYGENLGEDRWRFWNRAFLFSPGDTFDYSSKRIDMAHLPSYDKIHLVPYGEFVPWGTIWPFYLIETLIEEAGAGIFQRGKEITIFQTRSGAQFCLGICYESSRADQFAEGVSKGADFIVNITNDAWFKNSPGLKQHFLLSIFRAAENRCYVVRAANTGITGVIKPGGVVADTIPPNQRGYSTYELRLPNH